MRLHERELAPLKDRAVRIIDRIGRAIGLTYVEISDVQCRIVEKTDELIAHIQDRDSACNPFRIAFLALNDLRTERAVWYKPWIEHRLHNINMRYCDWWEQFDQKVGVATMLPIDSLVE